MKDFGEVIKYVEKTTGRKLTESEKHVIRCNCAIGEDLYEGRVATLEKYGIKLNRGMVRAE